MSRRLARLRVPLVWRTTAAVALMIAPAGPALAASAVPHCFNSELSTVNQAFDDVAPAESPMREEGDVTRSAPASNGLAGVLVSRALIDIADSYGFRWDCATQSFVGPPSATAPTTPSTMTTPTSGESPTTGITEQAVPAFTGNSTPAPTRPAPATTTTTRSLRESTGSAMTQDLAAPSTTEPPALNDGAAVDSPAAEEGGEETVPLPLAAPAPHHEGDAGRTAPVVAALAGVIGVGAGVLFGSRYLPGSGGAIGSARRNRK